MILAKTIKIFHRRAAVSVALLFSISLASTLERGEFEDRYLWVVRNTMTNPVSIDQMIQFATLNRINHIFVQVRGRGDAYYQSKIVSRSHLIQDEIFDPLAYLIPRAKEKGIKVHAWVNTYLLWSSRVKPVQKNHLLYINPEWIDQKKRDDFNINRELKRLNGGKNGNEGFYLSPNHPRVNSYLISVFKELIENYELDGLHLDYVRFHDSDYGQNPGAIAQYRKENGLKAIQLSTVAKDPMIDVNAGGWSDSRRKAVTELVRDTKSLIDVIRPKMVLSAAVKPNLYQARERYYQEWDVWLAAGYLDKAVVMNYTKNLKEFAANIDIMYDNLPKKYREKIVMGIATYNQSARQVVDKVKYTRVTRFKGISFFSYNVMVQNPRYFKSIKKVLYPRG
ncbi:MAG: hypothetical protein CMG28_02175 [Candidatus Marinimicrobia bacterium]|nr:hypothetical protein [Candidatus Neomarinimicrobiota bacterium]